MLDKLYIIRHGETYANAKRVYMEHSDLTSNGIKQAEMARDNILSNFKYLNFKNILTSPLTRAKDTASIINQKLNLPVTVIDELAEGKFGFLEGKAYSEMNHEMWQKWVRGEFILDGMETFNTLQDRIKIALNKISKYENPLIVGHGGTFFQIIKFLKINTEINFENCTLYCIENTNTKIGYRVFSFFGESLN